MYFSGHLIDSYSENVEYLAPDSISSCLDTESVKEKQRVSVCGIVSSVTVKATKKKEKMAFITVEDRYGEIECLIFPQKYTQLSHMLREDAPLYIEGNISLREEEEPKILVNAVEELCENGRFKRPATPHTPVGAREKKDAARTSNAVATDASALEPLAYKKLYLRVPRMDSSELRAADALLCRAGDTRVIYYDSSSAKYFDSGRDVLLDKGLLARLADILGESNVVPK